MTGHPDADGAQGEETTLSAVSQERTRLLRWAPVALLAAAFAVAVWLVASGGSHPYRLQFQNAGQLVKGDAVLVGGTSVGTIKSVELGAGHQAEIGITIGHAYGRLHDGTTATVRARSLVGQASRYVELSPGPSFAPALEDHALIPADKTTSIVDIDQLFNTLDPQTRRGLRRLIDGSASWYQGAERQANASAREFPKALRGLSDLSAEITRDNAAFTQFLVKTGDALAALDDRRTELTDVISNTRATTAALSADTTSLDSALRDLPPALRSGATTFARLRPAIADLRRLTDVTGPATKDLRPFLRQLQPVLDEAVPSFRRLRQMLARPGAANDLLDALDDLPSIDAQTRTGFANARKALGDSTPVFSFVRPYVPDLVGWVRNFGQAMAPYDANGHYARTEPVFDAFALRETPQGGELEPKPYDQRGRSDNLSLGNLRRCPGAAAPALPDGSSPFVDDGPLSNPDCDPTQRP